MSPNRHDAVAALLPLSAAGLLDAAEERSVREHVRECAECAARLEELGGISMALGALPPAVPPVDLVLRTQARISAELDAVADRRRGGVLALAGAGFGWVSWLAIWSLYRGLTDGWPSVVRFDWIGMAASAAISTVMALSAAAIGAAVLRGRGRAERSTI